MQILLINVNPVVSRLFVLCTREEDIRLDEVSRIGAVKNKQYDMVFVDESAYEKNTSVIISQFKNIQKIFISYDSEPVSGFDLTMEKPFLPSRIIELFENNILIQSTVEVEVEKESTSEAYIPMSEIIEEDEDEEEIDRVVPSIFPLASAEEDEEEEVTPVVENTPEETSNVLNIGEIEKIKNLLEMNEIEEMDDILSEEEIEKRKVELIKKQLIEEGLEIVEEEQMVEAFNLDALTMPDKKEKKKKRKKSKSKKKRLKFTEKNMERIEDAVEMAMANMTKKQMKKLLNGKEIEMRIKLKGKN